MRIKYGLFQDMGEFSGFISPAVTLNAANVACIYTFGRITSQWMHSVQEHCGLARCAGQETFR